MDGVADGRPAGQSFRESVGPTPAWIFRQSRGERGLRLSISLYKDGEPTLVSQIVENLSRAVRPQTRVVAVTWVHSCTGVKLPIRAMADGSAASAPAATNRTAC